MYNTEKIKECAVSLVGFREDSNPIYGELSEELTESTSGRWVNDLTQVTFETIGACLTKDQTADEYLLSAYNASVIDLVDRFVNRSKDKFQNKELLFNQSVVSGVQQFGHKVTQNQRFVGYWIRPHRSTNLLSKITELGFQSDALQGNLKIYLYITSQLEPLKTFDFEIDKEYSISWQKVEDWILEYESETQGTGQSYLLGYYEKQLSNPQATQLQGKALYMDFCNTCPGSPKILYSNYMGITPVAIPQQHLNWNGVDEYNIPIVDSIASFATSQTYGLLLKVNVKCDLTRIICQNIGMFSEAIQYSLAAKLLFDAYSTNRTNPISDSQRQHYKSFAMKYDGMLNGYTAEGGGRVKGILDNLTMDFSGLDYYCQKCKPEVTMGRLVR